MAPGQTVAAITDMDLLSGLPADLIRAAYAAAPGNELESGKFASPESSAALVANTFGFFLGRPAELPSLCEGQDSEWSPRSVRLEAVVRFPWAGGRHPCLDVLVETAGSLVGIESKRYEPFRPRAVVTLSDAYWRPVWGDRMRGYERLRDGLRDGTCRFRHLDAAQLLKHAFGLRTAARRMQREQAVGPLLLYLHAEPKQWPDGREVPPPEIAAHRREVAAFSELVSGDEVAFRACAYENLLAAWGASPVAAVGAHAAAVRLRFGL